jgi:hypothetical protein
VVGQCGVRRIRSAPCAVAKRAQSARGVALEQGLAGTPELLAHAGPGWARPVFFLQCAQGRVAGGMGPEQKPRRFREGPREMGVAALRARGPVALPRRRLRALDAAAIREAIWAPREAGALMAGLAQPSAPALAAPGDRTPAGQRLGLRRRGRCEDGPRHGAAPLVVVAHERAVACEALWHRGRGEPLSAPSRCALEARCCPLAGR